ncbi:methylamine utilization protein MauJ [Dongia sedimenti]|uniref:Apea-like HEPN domain-containing protein n=1 Tax=Dongia sedimenti TaxID=3064282 RepID=A0ABU0YQS2_9PROT|nr:hypothetical protein [Rhodospirillaceae bacterium R-7]
MFAKNLEHLLIELCRKSDFSSLTDVIDIAQRFDALRGCAKLPRHREHRAKHLSPREISFAVLGLIPSRPGWAGQGATALANLRCAGGSAAAFRGMTTLLETIELVLTDDTARESLVSVWISAAEDGVNSNGMAWLAYQDGTERRHVRYVSSMAVSLLQTGAEESIDRDVFFAPASRCLVFNKRFFRLIADAESKSILFPTEPVGDGSEYDAEEALRARYKALRVTNRSRFLNVGIETQATWPSEETLVKFGDHHLVLMPRTAENAQSIHVDLAENRITIEQARTVINHFLSAIAWSDDQFAIAHSGWAGNPVPVGVPKRSRSVSSAKVWFNEHTYPSSNDSRLALALYREGRNAEEASLVGYAVLSYFKVIEIKNQTGEKARKWISKNFFAVVEEGKADLQIQHFMEGCGGELPADYIYKACRVAVAHASTAQPSNADQFDETRRLYSAAYVIRLLARHMITRDLGVPTLL